MSGENAAARFCDQLAANGYTHCFFVAGGNVMHLLNAARTRFHCVPVVHEVAAGIAAEYFNATTDGARAFALVTAGPGLTNVLTAMAGAWLESRELLVVGGQVKTSDLSDGGIRQRGIQEIDGVALAAPVSKQSLRVERPEDLTAACAAIEAGGTGRPGPVFIEFCLDAQAAPCPPLSWSPQPPSLPSPSAEEVHRLATALEGAKRPVLLVGGGVPREAMAEILARCESLRLPLMTTWNGADRIDAGHHLYWGRPNTWGQRAANVLLQQADLIVAAGTRLGLQQTGFNWQEFAPKAKVVQIDIDAAELGKGHPRLDLGICADAGETLKAALTQTTTAPGRRQEWIAFGSQVRSSLPNNEDSNTRAAGFLNPYDFVEDLSTWLTPDDIVIPCSSGGAFTVMMQAFRQKQGQRIVTDKGLASMGYGLAGALGAAHAQPERRTILVEGDGGFAQNLQELGTAAASRLSIKMFLFINNGYASIRMTQRNYFNGAWVGCDVETGLGLPDWPKLAAAYGIPCLRVDELAAPAVQQLLAAPGPAMFLVPIDPEQTYFPKITSRVLADGSMVSNPLHLMTPELPEALAQAVMPYLNQGVPSEQD